MRRCKSLMLVMWLWLSASLAFAQDIMVNVRPVQPILPPQLLLYVDDPSQFFTVQLVNTSANEQLVYLSLSMEHTNPNDGLAMACPERYQPKTPFVVPASGVYQLSLTDMKNLFNHIPQTAMKIPDGLIDGYTNGSFGLLPEGDYTVQFHAFRWTGHNSDTPYMLSNPAMGKANFQVLYNASAPEFTNPISLGMGKVPEVNLQHVFFQWNRPVLGGAGNTTEYTYNFRMVEVPNLQSPEDAMLRNPVVYHKEQLVANSLTLTSTVVQQLHLDPTKTYAAQVTAVPRNTSKLNYVMLRNNGKSPIITFRFKDLGKVDTGGAADAVGDDGDDDGDDDDSDGDDKKKGHFSIEGDYESGENVPTYVFRNPELLNPVFDDGKVRRLYLYSPILVDWRPAWDLGKGTGRENLDIKYVVQVFNGKSEADRDKALEGKPIYESKPLDVVKDSIPWDDLEKAGVAEKDYLVLRVKPVCDTKDIELTYEEDKNIVDFTLIQPTTRHYFECSNTVDIENTTPTTKKGSDFKDKDVALGEYTLHIEDIEGGDATKGFKGKGYVLWAPLGAECKIRVKFDALKINTEDVVYDGEAETYGAPTLSNDQVVNQLFSDLGIEEIIASTGVPYAKKIVGGAKSTLASQVSGLQDYYKYVQDGNALYDALFKGKVDEPLYLPLELPADVVGQLPANMNIQISTMRFAPTWAYMDLLGEFALPDSKYLDTDLLVFGAPRLCMTPTSLLPESGQIALLGDMTIKDPGTDYKLTFKAPADVLHPADGCFLSWSEGQMEMFGLDVTMAIPKLNKVKDGKAVDERPELRICQNFYLKDGFDWNDLLVEQVTIDDFEVDGISGYVFKAQDISYDHSLYRNAKTVGDKPAFPEGFKRTASIPEDKFQANGYKAWMGLHINKMGVTFPKSFEVSGDDDDDDDDSYAPLSFDIENMFLDCAGATLDANINHLAKAKMGGFSISIDQIGLRVIQNNFNNCHLNGTLGVPLCKVTDAKGNKRPAAIKYECEMRKLDKPDSHGDARYAYIFTTQQEDMNISLDFFLAEAKFNRNLTYFLLEADPDEVTGELETKCELVMGGDISIGGKDAIQKWGSDKLGFDLHLPDIHFVGLRFANCEKFESKYRKDLQKGKDDKKSILDLYDNHQFQNGENFFFDTGAWSLASQQKQLGPFKFTLKDFGLDMGVNDKGQTTLNFSIDGSVALVEGLDIEAGAKVTLRSIVKNITDLSKLDIEFDKAHLDSVGVNTSFCGMKLSGYLVNKDEPDADGNRGFDAALSFSMPGDFFSLDAEGGLYKHEGSTSSSDDSYSWGWIDVKVGMQVNLGPLMLKDIHGGFYFNCKKNDKSKPTPKAGLVGVVLGVKLASADGKAVEGDLTMTVVYDRKHKCLTSFVMTGNVKAVGGLVNADVTLRYENNDQDQYFQLNMSLDAGIDNSKLVAAIGEFGGGLGTIADQLKELGGDMYKPTLAGCEQGLGDKIGANSKENKGEKEGKVETLNDVKAAAKTKDQEAMSAKAGLKISLDLKITSKRNGKKLSPAKWHLYLGEPDEDKRCSLTLIDVHTTIVSLTIGANCYLCVGSELPNNGELPPIPAKIANFLDGSTKGDGQVSDNISDANNARSKAMGGMASGISGGVMLGAQIYGGLTINLGIIYGSMNAIAGFDVSLVKLDGGYCTNLGRQPGYNHWYGRGQIYAYLGTELGVRINLGFFKKDLSLLNAEIGGVLKMGGPNPTYFTGKVRAKMSLLGGLFTLDKKFEFDCGEVCTLFLGNPLDGFILFDHCSIGDSIRANGWYLNDNAKQKSGESDFGINHQLTEIPYFNCHAPLDEHFRVLDKNFLDWEMNHTKLSEDKKWQLEMEAKRSFIFRAGSGDKDFLGNNYDKENAFLFEYEKAEDFDSLDNRERVSGFPAFMGKVSAYNTIPITKMGSNLRRYLDMKKMNQCLKPDRFYRLVICGRAFEVFQGEEIDPWYVDTIAGTRKKTPWKQKMSYYFRTKKAAVVDLDETPDLEPHVALAYPSFNNKLHNTVTFDDAIDPDDPNSKGDGSAKGYLKAYINDIQSPVISFNQDMSQSYKNGRLMWRLLDSGERTLQTRPASWVSLNDMYCVLEPKSKFTGVQAGNKYVLCLDYYANHEHQKEVWKEEAGTAYLDTVNYTKMDTLSLMRLYVEALPSTCDWRTGDTQYKSLQYEVPFVANVLKSISYVDAAGNKPDVEDSKLGPWIKDDPFHYYGYLANYAIPGGWEMTEHGWYDFKIANSESVIVNNLAGSSYTSYLSKSKSAKNYSNSWQQFRNTILYLPELHTANPTPLAGCWGKDPNYDYVMITDPRVFPYTPSPRGLPSRGVSKTIQYLADFYQSAADCQMRLQYEFNSCVGSMANSRGDSAKEDIADWFARRRGHYIAGANRFVRLGLTVNSQSALADNYIPGVDMWKFNQKDLNGNNISIVSSWYHLWLNVLGPLRYKKEVRNGILFIQQPDKTWINTGMSEEAACTMLNESGTGITQDSDSSFFAIPYYQIPGLISTSFLEEMDGCYKSLKYLERSDYSNMAQVWKNLADVYPGQYPKVHGRTPGGRQTYDKSAAMAKVDEMKFDTYRVNCYDYKNGIYRASEMLQNGVAKEEVTVKGFTTPSGSGVSGTQSSVVSGDYNHAGSSYGVDKTSTEGKQVDISEVTQDIQRRQTYITDAVLEDELKKLKAQSDKFDQRMKDEEADIEKSVKANFKELDNQHKKGAEYYNSCVNNYEAKPSTYATSYDKLCDCFTKFETAYRALTMARFDLANFHDYENYALTFERNWLSYYGKGGAMYDRAMRFLNKIHSNHSHCQELIDTIEQSQNPAIQVATPNRDHIGTNYLKLCELRDMKEYARTINTTASKDAAWQIVLDARDSVYNQLILLHSSLSSRLNLNQSTYNYAKNRTSFDNHYNAWESDPDNARAKSDLLYAFEHVIAALDSLDDRAEYADYIVGRANGDIRDAAGLDWPRHFMENRADQNRLIDDMAERLLELAPVNSTYMRQLQNYKRQSTDKMQQILDLQERAHAYADELHDTRFYVEQKIKKYESHLVELDPEITVKKDLVEELCKNAMALLDTIVVNDNNIQRIEDTFSDPKILDMFEDWEQKLKQSESVRSKYTAAQNKIYYNDLAKPYLDQLDGYLALIPQLSTCIDRMENKKTGYRTQFATMLDEIDEALGYLTGNNQYSKLSLTSELQALRDDVVKRSEPLLSKVRASQTKNLAEEAFKMGKQRIKADIFQYIDPDNYPYYSGWLFKKGYLEIVQLTVEPLATTAIANKKRFEDAFSNLTTSYLEYYTRYIQKRENLSFDWRKLTISQVIRDGEEAVTQWDNNLSQLWTYIDPSNKSNTDGFYYLSHYYVDNHTKHVNEIKAKKMDEDMKSQILSLEGEIYRKANNTLVPYVNQLYQQLKTQKQNASTATARKSTAENWLRTLYSDYTRNCNDSTIQINKIRLSLEDYTINTNSAASTLGTYKNSLETAYNNAIAYWEKNRALSDTQANAKKRYDYLTQCIAAIDRVAYSQLYETAKTYWRTRNTRDTNVNTWVTRVPLLYQYVMDHSAKPTDTWPLNATNFKQKFDTELPKYRSASTILNTNFRDLESFYNKLYQLRNSANSAKNMLYNKYKYTVSF